MEKVFTIYIFVSNVIMDVTAMKTNLPPIPVVSSCVFCSVDNSVFADVSCTLYRLVSTVVRSVVAVVEMISICSVVDLVSEINRNALYFCLFFYLTHSSADINPSMAFLS